MYVFEKRSSSRAASAAALPSGRSRQQEAGRQVCNCINYNCRQQQTDNSKVICAHARGSERLLKKDADANGKTPAVQMI
ncbi:hypothetical protein MmiAt1_15210 [Methanimicrococcus sp. At1]|uniref:Uncharacterized protein n=2 Tax=Methanimicrococcus hacksteinii TaxID=3028293 RepID=A0ABU3VR79_9EURY|nr:hypothetical protein [Methanimicrococcus sp. At1]